MPTSVNGVVALDVKRGIAQRFFKKGDIILEMNGSPVSSVDDLKASISAQAGFWDIQISRGGRKLQMTLR